MPNPLGGSSPSQQTTTQAQVLPTYEQQFSQENQDLARSIASQPFPVYQGQRNADFTPLQQQAFSQIPGAANSYQPALAQSQSMVQNSATPFSQANIGAYMNPYVMQALAPQLQALRTQQGQNQMAIDANATQAGAYGDARNGAASALNNFYGNVEQQGVIGQGLSNAFNSAQNAYQTDQNRQLLAGSAMSNLAGQQQQLGLQGANAIYGAGAQQQNLNQQNLNTAYQDFVNQVNWPIQMLQLRQQALSNSPYGTAQLTTAPPPNTSAQNMGLFSALTGSGLGGGSSGGSSLFGGGSSGGSGGLFSNFSGLFGGSGGIGGVGGSGLSDAAMGSLSSDALANVGAGAAGL